MDRFSGGDAYWMTFIYRTVTDPSWWKKDVREQKLETDGFGFKKGFVLGL